ncbi:peptidase inhibitor family I36 protein [Streptomyces scabiei]|uniref:peptidase inhibitor family I36 protein n=1 Tax=Streptomyces scabiei TaxID=1930 RepID=UPI0029A1623B|nr:peptidase inhibitor family I36 protein [Streptomyces scabiei]MDX3522421.1 peptidase inhibitor family I36 protein [Streptomyces scabiei]
MNLRRKSAVVLSTLALASAGIATTATPAAAVGGCPSGKLCLYEGTNFTSLTFTSASTKLCFDLTSYGNGFRNGVRSYVNNLPVKAEVFHRISRTSDVIELDGTISPGGSSSNAGSGFGVDGVVCTGGAR